MKSILSDSDFASLYYILGSYLGTAIREQLPANQIEAIRQLTMHLKDKLTELQNTYDNTHSSKT